MGDRKKSALALNNLDSHVFDYFLAGTDQSTNSGWHAARDKKIEQKVEIKRR